jgi:hypothetical protein
MRIERQYTRSRIRGRNTRSRIRLGLANAQKVLFYRKHWRRRMRRSDIIERHDLQPTAACRRRVGRFELCEQGLGGGRVRLKSPLSFRGWSRTSNAICWPFRGRAVGRVARWLRPIWVGSCALGRPVV